MADLNLLLGGALAALAVGTGAAQLEGPIANDWRTKKGLMKRRLLALYLKPPPRPARALGAATICLVLAGGALTAYAAQPGAPERLPSEVTGVVGSGDQLGLRLIRDKQELTIRPGEDYADGWKLDALTPTSATLVKDGERREVGLNPTGALAPYTHATPTSITLVGLPDEATIQAAVAAALADDPKALETAIHGGALTLEEARRYLAYRRVLEQEMTRRNAGTSGAWTAGLMAAGELPLLGEAGEADYDAIMRKILASDLADQIADLAARPPTGPTSYYLPAGVSFRQLPQAQEIDPRGVWSFSPPDAQGGRTATRLAGTADEVADYYATTGQNRARISLFSNRATP